MKKSVSLVLILAVCILWTGIPVLAEVVSGTVELEPIFLEAPDSVTLGPEHEEPFELSQEVSDWWDNIHRRRAEVESDIDRTQLGFDDTLSTFPPPTTEEFIDNEKYQPNDLIDFIWVIQEGLTSTENPNVKNESNPSVGFALMKKGFMVYNSGAARSWDHGRSWTYVNPNIGNPGSPWFFTGKQEVTFDPLYAIHLWVQLWGHPSGGGLLRIGASKNLSSWCFYTTLASTTILPDDPHIRLGHDLFYITFDQYSSSGSTWNRSGIARFGKATLMRCAGYHGSVYFDPGYRNYMVAKNHSHNSVMYAVSNSSGGVGKLKVWEWPEWTSASTRVITVSNWSHNTFTCPCPDGNDPCYQYSGYDDRVRAAVVTYKNDYPESSKRQMWVSFNAGIDGSHPMPYTYLVKIDMNTWNVLGYHHIWSSLWAWQNMDMVPNAAGDIGIVIDSLGGSYYTGVKVSILDNDIQDYGAPFSWWSLAPLGSPCPPADRWGHHNSVNLWWRNQFQFIAVGHINTFSGPRNYYGRFTNEKYFP